MIPPIADHLWHEIPDTEGILPPGHKMEYAQFEGTGVVVRIVGPRAHVFGQSKQHMSEAVNEALNWFESVGSEL